MSKDNKTVVEVTDGNGKPVSGMQIIIIDGNGTTGDKPTNESGVATVPKSNNDRTDENGYAEVTETKVDGSGKIVDTDYNVIVRGC